jgi:5'-3' exoribonuclease 1
MPLSQPHFFILRELVTFGGKHVSQAQQLLNATTEMDAVQGTPSKNAGDAEESWVYAKPLQTCQISVLREYLAGEFSVLQSIKHLDYDFERVIDDFVFMCFFVGECS